MDLREATWTVAIDLADRLGAPRVDPSAAVDYVRRHLTPDSVADYAPPRVRAAYRGVLRLTKDQLAAALAPEPAIAPSPAAAVLTPVSRVAPAPAPPSAVRPGRTHGTASPDDTPASPEQPKHRSIGSLRHAIRLVARDHRTRLATTDPTWRVCTDREVLDDVLANLAVHDASPDVAAAYAEVLAARDRGVNVRLLADA